MALDRMFERFRGGPVDQGPDALRVTLNRKGLIYMNARVHRALGSPKAVALYYNREADAIAIEPAYARFAENFPVVKKQNGWAVHASTFCRHYNIRVPNTERFIRPDITGEGQMILSLRETATVGGIVKKRRTE